MQELLKRYYAYLKELKIYRGISNLLEWDQENQMPHKAVEARSNENALISKLMHQKSTSKEYGEVINTLYENKETLDSTSKRSIEISKRDFDKVNKLPTEFVEEFSKLRSLAQSAWIDAKTKEDYSIFAPFLGKVFSMTKRYAEYIDASKPVYDVLLDDYEEGMTSAQLDKIFGDLKPKLIELLPKVKKHESKHILNGKSFDKDVTRKFLLEMTKQIGFDYQRGALGEVHHPFETKLSNHDVRINVRYKEDDISYSITGAIHELGHGLYEQFIDSRYFETDLAQGTSLGIHESQSRLLENVIGRSVPFWNYFLPKLQSYFPELKDANVEDIVNDLNLVKPSLIRTESDEVTYNFHIMLRYEIEQKLLNNELKIKDLPEFWNSSMKDLLGITPDKLSNGCLQDVHWSMGGIGYFPTYSLGNLNSAQLWHMFIQDNSDWTEKISNGDFSQYFNWFKNNIWQHGSLYKSNELMLNVTGEELNPEYFAEYLENKYL